MLASEKNTITNLLSVKDKNIKDEDLFDGINSGETAAIKAVLSQDKSPTAEAASSNLKINETYLFYYKTILQKSFELFEFRNTGYDCENFLKAFRKGKFDDLKVFSDTIINSLKENPLGLAYNNILFNHKSLLKITEDKDIFYLSMSYLIQNPTKNYTAVIFVPNVKGSNQISTLFSKMIITGIFSVIIQKVPVNEIVIIHSKNFYPEGLKLFSNFSKNFFLQFFSDIEIISPITECVFVPRIKVFTKEEEEEFFQENKFISKTAFKKIDISRDNLLKYYGVRPHTLVKIERIELYNDSSAVDVCFSYV